MKVQKIYSDQEGIEKFYSVLLTEDELNIYQREFGGNKANKVSRRAWEIENGRHLKDLDSIIDEGLGFKKFEPERFKPETFEPERFELNLKKESDVELIRRSRQGNTKSQRGVKKVKGQKIVDSRSLEDKKLDLQLKNPLRAYEVSSRVSKKRREEEERLAKEAREKAKAAKDSAARKIKAEELRKLKASRIRNAKIGVGVALATGAAIGGAAYLKNKKKKDKES